jgi:hypothetical protein
MSRNFVVIARHVERERDNLRQLNACPAPAHPTTDRPERSDPVPAWLIGALLMIGLASGLALLAALMLVGGLTGITLWAV